MCRLKSYNDNIHVDIHYRLHIAELCKEHLPQSDRTDISWPQHLIYSGTDVGGGNAWLAVSVHLKGVRCSWGQVFPHQTGMCDISKSYNVTETGRSHSLQQNPQSFKVLQYEHWSLQYMRRVFTSEVRAVLVVLHNRLERVFFSVLFLLI